MIRCRQLVDEAFVEIKTDHGNGEFYGARVTYSTGGGSFSPCAIYRGRGDDDLLECSLWEWNGAVEHGNVKWSGAPRTLFWNLRLNGMHRHRGPVTVRMEAIVGSVVPAWEVEIELECSKAIYLDEWSRYVGPDSGFAVGDGGLTWDSAPADATPTDTDPTVEIEPGVVGDFEVSFGLRSGTLMSRVSVSTEPVRYPFSVPIARAEFQGKKHKEIRWKRVRLERTSKIRISPYPLTVREPSVHPAGSIAYIKLVPVVPAKAKPAGKRVVPLALYLEPYSWAFSLGLASRSLVKEALTLYREMGADEIHNQIIRFGSRSLHHGRVAESGVTTDGLMGDDGTYSAAPAEMVREIDVLKESIEICRELGMTHFANAGLTNCYPGSGLEDRISREHPEWRRGHVLRYDVPETRSYAAAVVGEFVEWGADGVSIDCMRYPYYHTEEDLLALFDEFHRTIRKASGGRAVPITARIPAGDVVYYRAFEQLARSGVVSCVIPSTLFMREPRISLAPYLPWKEFGCRVYGIIDGWLSHIGSFNHYQLSLNRNPRDIREDIDRFVADGADGIFVYQADGHLADAFTREVFRSALEQRL
jgi:hypothetical protein